MAFPDTTYQPREIENIYGVTFDANDKKRLFAEDINAIGDEIVDIENYVLNLPTEGGTTGKIPFYKSSGVISNISLTLDSKIPFFLSSGIASNIALVV